MFEITIRVMNVHVNLNEQPKEMTSEFLLKYKHPYITDIPYEQVGLSDHLQYYHSMDHSDGIVFEAIVHMQISLNIHDHVDFKFDENQPPTQTNKSNELNALIGDYHSSLFYKLLSDHQKLDALFHFIQPVKRINHLKMELLHNRTLAHHTLIEYLEDIYMALYDAYADFYNVSNYEKLRQKLIYHFVYEEPSFWANYLLRNNKSIEEVLKSRKLHLKSLQSRE